jgi:hypothetical protein
MTTHFSAPSSLTSASRRRSSAGVHGPLIGLEVVDGEDVRIWKAPVAIALAVEAVDGVQTDDGGVRVPLRTGVIGEAMPDGFWSSKPFL